MTSPSLISLLGALAAKGLSSFAGKSSLRRATACTFIATALFAGLSRGAVDQSVATFAVMRNGERIGTNIVDITHQGSQTDVRTETHVEIRLAFITLYRFDQTETEKWASGRFLAMRTRTDDNGTVHDAKASTDDDETVVQSDGTSRKYPGTLIPVSLWNPEILAQHAVLDPQDGELVPIRVEDRGEENLVVLGRTVRAHHYVVMTTFSQDVWYDDGGRLVQVQLKARDGSTIRYQLV